MSIEKIIADALRNAAEQVEQASQRYVPTLCGLTAGEIMRLRDDVDQLKGLLATQEKATEANYGDLQAARADNERLRKKNTLLAVEVGLQRQRADSYKHRLFAGAYGYVVPPPYSGPVVPDLSFLKPLLERINCAQAPHRHPDGSLVRGTDPLSTKNPVAYIEGSEYASDGFDMYCVDFVCGCRLDLNVSRP